MFQFKNKKGFALIQVLLALTLGSIVAVGIVLHYRNVAKDETYQIVTNNIVQNSEISMQKNSIGEPSVKLFNEKGYQVTISSGQATVTSIDKNACSAISNTLKPRGNVTTANCNNSNPASNSIVFTPSKTNVIQNSNTILQPGTADNGSSNTVIPADLSGVYVAAGTNVATGSTPNSFNPEYGTSLSAPSMTGGNSGNISTGSVGNPSVTPTPGSTTGSTPMSCRYILANNPAFATSSLGARATSCPSGQVSTSNQTGTRTWSCPNPTAAVNPINTDTWVGGSCAVICVPYASQTSTASCSAGYTGVITNRQDSSCPTYTGTPVWGAPYQIGNTCAPAAPPSAGLNGICIGTSIGANNSPMCLFNQPSGSTVTYEVGYAAPAYPSCTYRTTLTSGATSQQVSVTSGNSPSTVQTYNVGGTNFTITVRGNSTNNCPAANPAFAGSCLERCTGTVTF